MTAPAPTSATKLARAPALAATGLTRAFGALRANENIDLSLNTGEIHAVIGPNGAGKTTLIAQLAGELRPDAGRILFGSRDVTGFSPVRRARLGLARSYQMSSLFESFTAAGNVAMAIQGRERRLLPFRDARSDPKLAAEAREHLEAVGAGDLADRPAPSLAHGERRQVELAMVLALRPSIVLLDEPMAGLGAAEAGIVTPVIGNLRKERAVLLVEHDMSVVFALADRITVLVAGRVIASGAPDEVRANPEVRAAYLTEDGTDA